MQGIARTNRKIGRYSQKLSPSLRQIDGKNAALFDRLTEKTPPKRTAFFPEQKEGKQ